MEYFKGKNKVSRIEVVGGFRLEDINEENEQS
jgi:hypothetical protein